MSDIKWFINNGDYFYFKDAPVHLSGVSLDKSEISFTTVGQTEQLTATIIPANPVETVSLNWSSSDTSIATVAPYEPRLPTEYQEVEYIESSGTQYIDTGWYPSSNYAKVVAQIEPTLSGQQWEVFYGMTNGSNHYSLHTNKDTLKWYINVGGSANIMTDIAFSSGTKVNTEFEANNGAYSVKVNSSTYSGTYSGTVVQSARNMYIFAYNENGSITWKQNMKLYSFKIYSDASTLVRDLVPCYRKADNVIGLYDLVNDTFYTNAGTGTFTKGSDINPDAIVTCVTPGSCTITVTTTPGSYTASCEVYKILTYDFTTSDAGWNANGCSRDSRGFYRNNTWSDGWVKSPAEVFDSSPKKITIVFNKVNQSSGTALGGDAPLEYWYGLPMEYNQQQRLVARVSGSDTTYNLSGIPSGVTTWEMDVDKSTTPRTITHKITGLTDVTESSGLLDYLWSNASNLSIRIVNWSGSTGSMCIISFTAVY